MKWITRSHVHVDRVACPWLITRFIEITKRNFCLSQQIKLRR
ncbi:MAG: chromate resistance protein ChrB domain-containing protein [Anaerolineales bacterium]